MPRVVVYACAVVQIIQVGAVLKRSVISNSSRLSTNLEDAPDLQRHPTEDSNSRSAKSDDGVMEVNRSSTATSLKASGVEQFVLSVAASKPSVSNFLALGAEMSPSQGQTTQLASSADKTILILVVVILVVMLPCYIAGASFLQVVESGPAYDYGDAVMEKLQASTQAQYQILVLISGLPTLVMIFVLDIGRAGIPSMFVFHGTAVVAACMYGIIADGYDMWFPIKFLQRQFSGSAVRHLQLFRSIVAFVSLTSLALGCVVLMAHVCGLVQSLWPPLRYDIMNFGFFLRPTPSVLFMLYFTFGNSLIEELFWRGFLIERCGYSQIAWILTSFGYASYHFCVLYALAFFAGVALDICTSLVLTIGLTLAGMVLAAIYVQHGICLAWAVHASVDAAICLCTYPYHTTSLYQSIVS